MFKNVGLVHSDGSGIKKLNFGSADVEKMGLTRQVIQDLEIFFFSFHVNLSL